LFLALTSGDVKQLVEDFNRLLASIPYKVTNFHIEQIMNKNLITASFLLTKQPK